MELKHQPIVRLPPIAVQFLLGIVGVAGGMSLPMLK